jgi:hypothetical protein
MSEIIYDDPEDQNYCYKTILSYTSENEEDISLSGQYYLRCRNCGAFTRLHECPNCHWGYLMRNGYSIKKCVCGFDITNHVWVCTKCWEKNTWINDRFVHRTEKKKDDEGCFIATACFGSYGSPEVIILRQYRDRVLQRTKLGEKVICLYYMVSPHVARYISQHQHIKKLVKYLLRNIVLRYVQNIIRK